MHKIIRHSGAALALALLLTALSSGKAEAQSQEGQVRLGGDVGVFSGVWFPERDFASVSFGIFGGFGPSIGFALSEAIIIGGRLNLGGTWTETDTGIGSVDTFNGSLSVLPYFEFNIVGDNVIQPFFGAEVGYNWQFGDGIDDDGRFVVGGLGGIHIFATQDFSISPTGRVGFQYDFFVEDAALYWAVGIQVLGWIGGNNTNIQIQTR
jgi:hypothetical protein